MLQGQWEFFFPVELIHIISEFASLELGEQQVRLLATMLYGILKGNPQMFRLKMKLDKIGDKDED